MKKSTYKILIDKKGAALVMVLVVFSIVSIFVLGLNFLASNEAGAISRHQDTYQAEYLAVSATEIIAEYVLEQIHFSSKHDLNVANDALILEIKFDKDIKPTIEPNEVAVVSKIVKKPHGLTIESVATVNSTTVEKKLRIGDGNVATNRTFPREEITKVDTDYVLYGKAFIPTNFVNKGNLVIVENPDFEEDRIEYNSDENCSYGDYIIEEGGALVINTNDEDIVLSVDNFTVNGDLIIEDDGRLIIFVKNSMEFTTPFLNRSDNLVIFYMNEGNKEILIDIDEEYKALNRNRFYGYIYAVSNSGNVTVKIGEHTDFFGGIIADELELETGSQLFYRPPLKVSELRTYLNINEPLNFERGLYE